MTIGNIYFALVDPGEVFDPLVHNREDAEVFFFQIEQSEGQFARAEIEIQNPGQGILNPSRKRRVFISCDHNGTTKLLFSGRVIGFPTDLATETIRLEYIGQPENWKNTQDTFMQSLKVAPFWNDLFVSEDRRDDPAEVLAARSALLHWDRATNAVSLSEIIKGGTTLDLGGTVIFDSVRTQISDPPVNSVNIGVEVQYEQFGVGEVNAGEAIRQGFTNSAIGTPEINTLTPLSFEDAWRGVRIPNGYEVLESQLSPVANAFGLLQANLRSNAATVSGLDFPTKTGAEPASRSVTVPRVWYRGTLTLQAIYEQKRRETMIATLTAENQDFSLRGNQTEEIFVRLQDPTAAAQGSVHDAKLPSFFYDTVSGELTSYGRDAVEHALLRGRARLVKANRAIEARIETNLDDVLDVKMDHSIRFEDDRVPGGEITGKVTNYIFSWDGDSGQQVAKIKIASAIGTGQASENLGTPGEVELFGDPEVSFSTDIDTYSFDGDTFDAGGLAPFFGSTEWRDDGLSFYAGAGTTDRAVQIDLGSPFLISGGSHTASKYVAFGGSRLVGLKWKPDGSRLFSLDLVSDFKWMDIPTPYELDNSYTVTGTADLSVYLSGVDGFDISPDGTKMIICSGGDIVQLSMSTPWEPSTLTPDGVTYSPGGSIVGVRYGEGGGVLYVLQSNTPAAEFTTLEEHELPAPYDLTGASNTGRIFESPGKNANDFAISQDFNHLIFPSINTTPDAYHAEREQIVVSKTSSSFFYDLDSTPTIPQPINVADMESDDQYLIENVNIENGGEVQNSGFSATSRPDTYLQDNPTKVTVDLKSMNPENELFSLIEIQNTDLPLPRQINLEA